MVALKLNQSCLREGAKLAAEAADLRLKVSFQGCSQSMV